MDHARIFTRDTKDLAKVLQVGNAPLYDLEMQTDWSHNKLSCPNCGGRVAASRAGALSCKGCSTKYPVFDGIPWLFADPDGALAEWKDRYDLYLTKLKEEVKELQDSLRHPAGPPSASVRLKALLEGKRGQIGLIKRILAPLRALPGKPKEVHHAFGVSLPDSQTLLTYYNNLHRDWNWGDEENRLSLEAVLRAMPAGDEPGEMLVLGSGASRLAYDLHQKLSSAKTLALDLNPLLLLAAARLVRGETLQLYEFPALPLNLESWAVLRELRAPSAAREGFSFLLSDGLRPPFQKQSFDFILTPWFVDIVPQDIQDFFKTLNQLLTVGGSWVYFGPWAFISANLKNRYSREETMEIAHLCGFEVTHSELVQTPYMCSPDSCHWRTERILCFAATKKRDVRPAKAYDHLPGWLRDPSAAIPALVSFRAMAFVNRIHLEILSAIDGKRSLTEIAKVVSARYKMTPKGALQSVRRFFMELYEQGRLAV